MDFQSSKFFNKVAATLTYASFSKSVVLLDKFPVMHKFTLHFSVWIYCIAELCKYQFWSAVKLLYNLQFLKYICSWTAHHTLWITVQIGSFNTPKLWLMRYNASITASGLYWPHFCCAGLPHMNHGLCGIVHSLTTPVLHWSHFRRGAPLHMNCDQFGAETGK